MDNAAQRLLDRQISTCGAGVDMPCDVAEMGDLERAKSFTILFKHSGKEAKPPQGEYFEFGHQQPLGRRIEDCRLFEMTEEICDFILAYSVSIRTGECGARELDVPCPMGHVVAEFVFWAVRSLRAYQARAAMSE